MNTSGNYASLAGMKKMKTKKPKMIKPAKMPKMTKSGDPMALTRQQKVPSAMPRSGGRKRPRGF